MNKVYCSKCKHHWEGYSSLCAHPDNLADTYYAPKQCFKLDPETKNKNNNCPDFEQEVSFWKKLFNKTTTNGEQK